MQVVEDAVHTAQFQARNPSMPSLPNHRKMGDGKQAVKQAREAKSSTQREGERP
jgi:hypothetical protein